MKRYYCALFDKNYLYQGIVLHRSLLRHAADFHLYVLCMDTTAYSVVDRMKGATLTPIRVDELLTAEVARVRERTTHGQFCWVCQPLLCEFILERYGADMITYLETDSMFFSSPEVLFQELGDRCVSLVPHNYSAEFNNEATAGKFCVQFNAFRNDSAARNVLQSWRQSCFEYDRSAPLRYPGQTCLDDWPARFPCVAVLHHRGAGVAPWNVRGYALDSSMPTPMVNGSPVIFFHYHQYGRYRDGSHELGSYPISREVLECFYRPYVRELRMAEMDVRRADPGFSFRREYPDITTLGHVFRLRSRQSCLEFGRVLKRKLRGRFNVFPDAKFD